MLKHGILGLLNYGDMTGYEIMLVFRDSLSHFRTAQTSQIYRELRDLERSGWVTSSHAEQQGRPDKNIFAITESGKTELLKWLSDEKISEPPRSLLLMKTFFLGERGIDENISFFRRVSEDASIFPKGAEQTSDDVMHYGKKIGDPYKALYRRFTVDFGLMYRRLLREWSEKCIAELEGLRDENSSDKRQP